MEKCLRMYGNIIEWLKKIKEKTMKHNNMQFLRNLCWIQFFFTLHKMNVILTPQKFEVKSTPMAMVLHCVYVLLVSCSKQNKQRIFCGTRCHLNWIGICAVRWGISIYSRSQENPSYSSQVFWLFLLYICCNHNNNNNKSVWLTSSALFHIYFNSMLFYGMLPNFNIYCNSIEWFNLSQHVRSANFYCSRRLWRGFFSVYLWSPKLFRPSRLWA